jgi:excisionase family DNA binding protein
MSPAPAEKSPPRFWRVREFAEMAAISRSFVHKLVSSAAISSVRMGRAVRIPRAAKERLRLRERDAE